MYLILNRTTGVTTKVEGNYPYNTIQELLNNDQDIIIISLYSGVIKVPYLHQPEAAHEEPYWSNKDYNVPMQIFSNGWLSGKR